VHARGRTMAARTHHVRADAPCPRGRECFTPGNFKMDATVRPSYGRPRGHRPIVRKHLCDNHDQEHSRHGISSVADRDSSSWELQQPQTQHRQSQVSHRTSLLPSVFKFLQNSMLQSMPKAHSPILAKFPYNTLP
jgi:hypothetical protein